MYQSQTQTQTRSLTATATLSRSQQNVEFIRPSIQFDPRVRRGPTLSSTAAQQNLEKTLPAKSAKSSGASDPYSRANLAAKKAKLLAEGKIRPAQPSVAQLHSEINSKIVKKRVEFPMQLYLEEQEPQVIVKDANEQCEDSEFLPEESEEYLPLVAGDREAATQIDLEHVFIYDRDCMPLIEVLTAKILETALTEVKEEMELLEIRENSQRLRDKYRQEELEAERIAQQELDAYERKKQRIMIEKQRLMKEWQLRNKVMSSELSRAYLRGLQGFVLQSMDKQSSQALSSASSQSQSSTPQLIEWGIQHAIHTEFLPSVESSLESQLSTTQQSQRLLEFLLLKGFNEQVERDSVQRQEIREQRRLERDQEEKQRLDGEFQRLKARKIQLFINCESLLKGQQNQNQSAAVTNGVENPNVFGPFPLTGASTFGELANAVVEFFKPSQRDDEDEEEEKEPPVPLDQLPFLWENRIQFSIKTRSAQTSAPSDADQINALFSSFSLSPSDAAAQLAARAAQSSAPVQSPDTMLLSSKDDFVLSLAELEMKYGRNALSQIRLSLRELTPTEASEWEVEKARRQEEKEQAEEDEEEERD